MNKIFSLYISALTLIVSSISFFSVGTSYGSTNTVCGTQCYSNDYIFISIPELQMDRFETRIDVLQGVLFDIYAGDENVTNSVEYELALSIIRALKLDSQNKKQDRELHLMFLRYAQFRDSVPLTSKHLSCLTVRESRVLNDAALRTQAYRDRYLNSFKEGCPWHPPSIKKWVRKAKVSRRGQKGGTQNAPNKTGKELRNKKQKSIGGRSQHSTNSISKVKI